MNKETKDAFVKMLLKIGGDPCFSYLDKDKNMYKVIDGKLICKPAISKDGGYTWEWQ